MDGAINSHCLLADPHMPLIERTRGLLETRFGSVFVVANADALEEGVRRLKPGVAVLDLALAGGDLEALAARLKEASPQTRLIVLTVHEAPAVAETVLAAGLDAVVLKRFIARDLLPAVEAVLSHDVFVTAELSPAPSDPPTASS